MMMMMLVWGPHLQNHCLILPEDFHLLKSASQSEVTGQSPCWCWKSQVLENPSNSGKWGQMVTTKVYHILILRTLHGIRDLANVIKNLEKIILDYFSGSKVIIRSFISEWRRPESKYQNQRFEGATLPSAGFEVAGWSHSKGMSTPSKGWERQGTRAFRGSAALLTTWF